MSATLHPPESISPDHQRRMKEVRLLLCADRIARAPGPRAAPVATRLFALARHANCDCMDCRPWTY